jgi:hypothetical protein
MLGEKLFLPGSAPNAKACGNPAANMGLLAANALPLQAQPKKPATGPVYRTMGLSRGAKMQALAAAVDSISNDLAAAKDRLFDAIASTERGSQASLYQRGKVEEAQVGVEAFAEMEADWSKLVGTWWIIFTTASDVRPLVGPIANGPTPFRISRVGQRFSTPEEGKVQNLIEVRAVGPFVGGSSATLVVDAVYECRTARSLALRFQAAGVDDVKISGSLQNLLAPPLLPRGWWNLAVLQALESAAIRLPLVTRVPGVTNQSRNPIGFNYSITFVDDDLLIGRASNGTYIFKRDGSETFE